MAVDHIRYDVLVQEALRGMVRDVLVDIARKGLPGDHHFFITFDTNAEGVRLSERLHERYPEEMTVVLQHQFWDLEVYSDRFRVILKFSGQPHPITIPLSAITRFFDPSVKFGLHFEHHNHDEARMASGDDAGHPAPREAPAQGAEAPAAGSDSSVVSLDAFRKK